MISFPQVPVTDVRDVLIAELREQLSACQKELGELRELAKRYREHLWWLVGGGEFSAWFVESDVSLPVGAMKEWDEAKEFIEIADAAMKEKS